MHEQNLLCADEQIASLIEMLDTEEHSGLRRLDEALIAFASDPRLHFLKGSFLAGNGDYPAAIASVRRAVDLAPGFDLARFQLGFLLLTSDEPYAAQEAWGPLHGLAREAYLRVFTEGLCHLIREEFDDAMASLAKGITLNQDNALLNRDMRLLLDQIAARQSGAPASSDMMISAEQPMSAAQLLLQQAALKATRH